ncbi:hypothetical protein JCM19239_163 [Vibrio variabilis]|uniref:Uncharacterized protein n=1 Tax=Vibrio variabilis TaxID=990271 RepID=A0ABQ0JD19_9VIBR|nr:hypothetical protein JCM19239_163 [Vibrio variabilis]
MLIGVGTIIAAPQAASVTAMEAASAVLQSFIVKPHFL